MKAQVNEAMIDGRAEFEGFVYKALDISRDDDGEYVNQTTAAVWVGWTAGRWKMFHAVNEEMKKRK